MSKKIGLIIFTSCSVFVIFLGLYFSGVSVKFGDGKNSPVVGFIIENSHTGLVPADMSQVALNDKNANANRFAVNNQNKVQNTQSANKSTVAMNNDNPIVLFDVSVQPMFTKNNTAGILLLSAVFLLILMFAINILNKTRRKSRLKKAFKK
jgi:hypothetical protein